MSSTNDSGDFNTIVSLRGVKNYFLSKDLAFIAVDGSFSEAITDEGSLSYIVIGIVKGIIFKDGRYAIDGIEVKDEICKCSAEERMRELEYNVLEKYYNIVDIIFLDRKLSYDSSLNISIPQNSIGIVKDFDADIRSRLRLISDTPWLIIKEKREKVISAYYKLFPQSWVFYIESYIFTEDLEKLLFLLYALGKEPISEALGYNYPLFLADKLAKYYRNRMSNLMNMIQRHSNIRYREFRSWVERLRNDGRYI
ncbi:MAG: DNA double-strand break repair nuclease NurA [Saccharolobus sp.]